jgi:hypothetical protein
MNERKFQLRLLVQIKTLFLDSTTQVNFISDDRMLRNTYLYENRMYTNKVNAESFGVGKEKRVVLIKRVKLTQWFEEALQGHALFKASPSGLENVS